jgi:hypothetical protein
MTDLATLARVLRLGDDRLRIQDGNKLIALVGSADATDTTIQKAPGANASGAFVVLGRCGLSDINSDCYVGACPFRQSAPRYPPAVATRRTTYRVQCHRRAFVSGFTVAQFVVPARSQSTSPRAALKCA